MIRQRIGQMALAATAAWGFAAAAQAGDITFWTWRQEDKAAYTELFNDFTKANPDIHVKFEALPDDNYPTLVSAGLAAGHGADVIQAHAYGWLEQYAKAGYFLAIDEAVVPELANQPADALRSSTLRADKKIYSMPFASQTLGVFVNNEVFAKAGVKPAATWDEFIQLCKTLKDKGVIPIANGLGTSWFNEMFVLDLTNPFLGPSFVDDLQTGKATFKDPRYVAALGHLLELRDYMPPGFSGVDYPTSQQLFLTGRAGMFIGGSFEIASFRQQNPKIDMSFVAPPAPKAGDPRYVTKFFDGGYAINAKSKDIPDAIKLVRWMGTKEYGDKFSALLGNISPIKGVVIADPMLAEVARLNQVAMPQINVVYFRFEKPTGSELLQGGIQKMMAGTITPAELGANMTQGIARYYGPFQGK